MGMWCVDCDGAAYLCGAAVCGAVMVWCGVWLSGVGCGYNSIMWCDVMLCSLGVGVAGCGVRV